MPEVFGMEQSLFSTELMQILKEDLEKILLQAGFSEIARLFEAKKESLPY